MTSEYVQQLHLKRTAVAVMPAVRPDADERAGLPRPVKRARLANIFCRGALERLALGVVASSSARAM
eukprot:6187417-Pleurochrysis_carterae.AAC.2